MNDIGNTTKGAANIKVKLESVVLKHPQDWVAPFQEGYKKSLKK
jgi:hypothetical protein